MTHRTVKIAEFLLARIAEDESAARMLGSARVLAECAAKREIVRRFYYWDSGGPDAGIAIGDLGYAPDCAPAEGLEEAIRALAVVYSDHPDYDTARSPW